MIILTINSGSSSVKLAAFDARRAEAPSLMVRARLTRDAALPEAALASFLRDLHDAPIVAAAHRIVHGGTRFTRPVRIDDTVVPAIEALSALAPLHNPVGLHWIAAARQLLPPPVVHVAAFDTAFFADLPRTAAEYAVPATLGGSAGVRRYGFHGLAHEAMWRRWCEIHPRLDRGGRIVTLQLGGGCSAAAIARGRPLDTSMGFSPLEGLMMATRAGDIDAAVVPYLAARLGCSAAQVVQRLNEESGVLGVSGMSPDIGALVDDASESAQHALEMYCYRVRKCIGAYFAALGGCDGILFGGGVGEHVPQVRARILEGLQWLRVRLDVGANAGAVGGEARISAGHSPVAVHVLPGDEELSLTRAALSLL